ncbi:protein PHYTOCHROME-DEPENDENT LATE-FLOWERING isoform X2 [Neltuma alba]|uniref:protein PHYTOCHROME-DEPENDENT LATE-FLOWERING isoform X2 n=1 Tax=Neltuma alba TaxID=207710 RepID=UPI0010A3730A|nr:protein PHYTOCHROME-DEPENDENT LATE-FLOWERING isoform X2 [Prosopis alba]
MGVSFKVSKTGSRFRPKPLLSEASEDGPLENSKSSSRAVAFKNEFSRREPKNNLVQSGEKIARVPDASISSGAMSVTENEASFTLNLFPDGYSIGKPLENETTNQSTYQEFPKLLHPYDRMSESLFLAIESGHLPGDILDDIPCKYVDGALICEVRDYRRCSSDKGSGHASTDVSPTVTKVRLRMSLENVVKDIPLISDKSWTYGDFMEFESKILKALQPQLHLDPTPRLDRLSDGPVPTKLNLSLSSLRRKRLRQMPEFTVTSSNKIHGKKVCIDRVPESSTPRLGEPGIVASNAMIQQTHDNLASQDLGASNAMSLRPKSFVSDPSISGLSMMSHQSRYQMGVGTPRSLPEHGPISAMNTSGASPAAQDMIISYGDNANSGSSLHGKREHQDGQTSPLSNFAKRMRPTDGMQQSQTGPHGDALQGSDINWQNALLPQSQAMSRGIQYQSAGVQKFPQQAFEGRLNQDTGTLQFAAGQQPMRVVAKEEQFALDKSDGSEINRNKSEVQMEMDANLLDHQQSRLQQRLPQHAFMRSNFSQTTWNNLGQHIEKEVRKDDQLQRRKSVQSPRLSGGTLAQSPLSSKSGEFSNGSVGPSFGPASAAAAMGSQKDKTIMSFPAAGGTPPLTSTANDSTQRQHQAQVAAKRRANSLPKTPAINGVGSPASVSNVSVPLNANSPSVGTPALADQTQTILERFSKFEMVTMRHQLNCKKNKVDDCPIRKQNSYSPQHVAVCLANASSNEGFKDDTKSLSKSLVGGSMNVSKIRILSFWLPERVVQGNVVSLVPKLRTRLIMSEKPSDGTVAMHYGDIEDVDFLAAEDHLPTLPNAHFADLLAMQFSSLMDREGYMNDGDLIQSKPNRMNHPSGSQPSGVAGTHNAAVEMQQYGESIPGQLPNEIAKPSTTSGNTSLNSSQNHLANGRMLPPGNPPALQMSQGLLSGVSMAPRPQQLDPQQSVQQQHQQHQQQQLQPNQHSLIQQQNPQFPISSMMLGTSPLPHLGTMGQNSNMQMGNHVVKQPLQMQLMQQQQQQQYQQQQHQPQMQRKMMGLGTAVGLGNFRNNMVGLGGLGSPMAASKPTANEPTNSDEPAAAELRGNPSHECW